jgi:hypothetical protein
MVNLRGWLRKIERDSKESADTIVVVDSENGDEIEVPRNAGLYVIANALEDEEDVYREYPWMKEFLPRLDRLVLRDSGEPFFLEDLRWSGKTAWNAEQEKG